MKTIQESIANKVVLISGGTRGIGYATSASFLENGAKVVILGSRKETIEKATSQLREAYSKQSLLGYYPDLKDNKAIQEMVAEVIKTWGRIDVLINNAGVSDATPIYQYQEHHFEDVMNINLNPIFNMIKIIAPIMKAQGGGVILNTSSMVSLYGQRSGVAYPTSKFAVNGLTKSLARELGPDHIRVNAVAPGVTQTDMVAALDQNMVKMMEAQIPLQRVGKPEEVADAFLFLASDMASYITGEILSVDGAMIV